MKLSAAALAATSPDSFRGRGQWEEGASHITPNVRSSARRECPLLAQSGNFLSGSVS